MQPWAFLSEAKAAHGRSADKYSLEWLRVQS